MRRGSSKDGVIDKESQSCLTEMLEKDDAVRHRVSNVKVVLVVLSSKGMVFDQQSLRHQIALVYPDSIIFFQATGGYPMGAVPPDHIDLAIDFTGPGEMQSFFFPFKLRRKARVVVGRNAGFLRKRIYDQFYDESANQIPLELLARERFVQKKVLALAGVGFIQAGETPSDRSKSIALELPGMQRL